MTPQARAALRSVSEALRERSQQFHRDERERTSTFAGGHDVEVWEECRSHPCRSDRAVLVSVLALLADPAPPPATTTNAPICGNGYHFAADGAMRCACGSRTVAAAEPERFKPSPDALSAANEKESSSSPPQEHETMSEKQPLVQINTVLRPAGAESSSFTAPGATLVDWSLPVAPVALTYQPPERSDARAVPIMCRNRRGVAMTRPALAVLRELVDELEGAYANAVNLSAETAVFMQITLPLWLDRVLALLDAQAEVPVATQTSDDIREALRLLHAAGASETALVPLREELARLAEEATLNAAAASEAERNGSLATSDTRADPATSLVSGPLTYEIQERVCPVCGPHRNGAVTLTGFGVPVDGEYCNLCFGRWLAGQLPRLLPV